MWARSPSSPLSVCSSRFCCRGKTILQLDIRKKYGVNILGVRENGVLNMNITPDMTMDKGKSLLVLGNERSVQKCFRI